MNYTVLLGLHVLSSVAFYLKPSAFYRTSNAPWHLQGDWGYSVTLQAAECLDQMLSEFTNLPHDR